MSGAHCIDFYNKSTLTFIVLYLCISSCFLLHCHLLKRSAESFAAPVCSCRVLRWVWIPRCALVKPGSNCIPWGHVLPVWERGEWPWIVVPPGLQLLLRVTLGDGSFVPQQQQGGCRWGREPFTALSRAHPSCLCIHEDLSSLEPALQQSLLFVARKLLLHTAVRTRGCFSSELKSLYFTVCCEL